MAKLSRLLTTTVLGAVFGLICMVGSYYSFQVPFWPLGVSFLLHHSVMGFAIGASGLKINWAAHGILWGILFGVFLSVNVAERSGGFWMVALVLPIIYAFLIETLATKAFKQPQ